MERANLTQKIDAKNNTTPTQPQKAVSTPSLNSPVEQIMLLQRTIGNQAVGQLFKSGLIQAKLKIGEPNDVYEKEANRIADIVMRMPDEAISSQRSAISKLSESVQTKPT